MAKRKKSKVHDRLFKWLIVSFLEEFFGHYFPAVSVGKYEFLDKEFINRYEALRDSLEGDLFILVEAKIDDKWQNVMIQLEHQSRRMNMARRVFRYACYSWLLKEKPIWSIVIYTDNAVWRKQVGTRFYYGFESQVGKQFHRFDVIKIKKEKSEQLIREQSLLCKLLALKANDRGCDREVLIREILRTLKKESLKQPSEKLLMTLQFIEQYKQIPPDRYETIRKEVDMAFIATHITEHYEHIGEVRGEKRGIKIGEVRGEIKGKLSLLQEFYEKGILSKEDYESQSSLLKEKLKALKKVQNMQ